MKYRTYLIFGAPGSGKGTQGKILGAIPRSVQQAQIMQDMIEVRKVFHLDCPDRNALVGRLKKRALKENRFDDANEDVIRRRLATYDAESKPVLDFYGPD